MKRLVATTALALIFTSPAFVASGEVKEMTAIERLEQGDILASALIGMRIYATEEDVDTDADVADREKEWDDLGEVNDVILTTDGNVKAVVLGIGGFLGIGERDIAIDMSSLTFVREADDSDDFFLVVNANKEMLIDVPAYDRSAAGERMDKAASADKAPADKMAKPDTGDQAASKQKAEVDKQQMAAKDKAEADKMAKTEANKNDQMAAEKGDSEFMLTRPALTREGYRDAEVQEITAEMLEDARVYGSNDEDVGEINRLVLTEDGQIKHAVVDVGGFLGLGEHPIAVTMDELQILRAEDGGGIRVHIDSTQTELEKKPAYRG